MMITVASYIEGAGCICRRGSL